MLEQLQDERRRDVVRQVGDEHPAGRRCEHLAPVARHRVGLEHRDPERLDQLPENRHDASVHLDRRNRGPGRGERDGERAEAGSDLEDRVTRTDLGDPCDALDGIRVDDEVLAEGFGGMKAVLSEQAGDLRPPGRLGPARAGRRLRPGRPLRARRSQFPRPKAFSAFIQLTAARTSGSKPLTFASALPTRATLLGSLRRPR